MLLSLFFCLFRKEEVLGAYVRFAYRPGGF